MLFANTGLRAFKYIQIANQKCAVKPNMSSTINDLSLNKIPDVNFLRVNIITPILT